ncbi:MAG: hypothetical protein ACQRW7_13390 [Caulobacterales bacterium]|uniref:hypothetical protein n=1 Tax=Glycocaulis sp. TaxID=1969725 RepID=UPI003FA0C635
MPIVAIILAAGMAVDCPPYAELGQPESGVVFEYRGQSRGFPAGLRETVLAQERGAVRITRELSLGESEFNPLGEEVSIAGGLFAAAREGSPQELLSAGDAERIERLDAGSELAITVPGPQGSREMTVRFDGCTGSSHGPVSVYRHWYGSDQDSATVTQISHADGWWVMRRGERTSFTRE